MIKTYRYVIHLGLVVALAAMIGCQKESGDQIGQTSADSNAVTTPCDSIVIDLVATDSTTALDILQESHYVAYKSSLMGVFVTSIDSIESGTSTFWLYSVNGTMAEVACDKRAISPGDTVRWHFRHADR